MEEKYNLIGQADTNPKLIGFDGASLFSIKILSLRSPFRFDTEKKI